MRRAPGPTERESLRRRRMAEQEEVDGTRRFEVREVAPRQLQVRAGEGRRLLGELERAAVRGALEPAREPSARSEGRKLEREEEQQRLGQHARVGHPRPQYRPKDEDSDGRPG